LVAAIVVALALIAMAVDGVISVINASAAAV
jgi:hypothetical protein